MIHRNGGLLAIVLVIVVIMAVEADVTVATTLAAITDNIQISQTCPHQGPNGTPTFPTVKCLLSRMGWAVAIYAAVVVFTGAVTGQVAIQ